MLRAERNAADNTVAAYRRDLEDLQKFLATGSHAPAAATEDDLKRYFGKLARAGMTPRTVARRLSALRQF